MTLQNLKRIAGWEGLLKFGTYIGLWLELIELIVRFLLNLCK